MPPPKTAAQLTLERQLSGAVFASQSAAASAVAEVRACRRRRVPRSHRPPVRIRASWRRCCGPSVAHAVRAEVLPAQRLLLPKGAFIDCTLETAIDSTLAGDDHVRDGDGCLRRRRQRRSAGARHQAHRRDSRPGAAGSGSCFRALDRGAHAGRRRRAARFARRGRAGPRRASGEVNRHFWERFGAAMLVSIIDGAVEASSSLARTATARSSSIHRPRKA